MQNSMTRLRKASRVLAATLLLVFCGDVAMAAIRPLSLAHGPTTPEMGSFTPVEAGEWVDKFTGDFNYNIPLFEIGSYPVNLAYGSNVPVESDASWVGLGWNLNPGAISRSMRGVPDDYAPGSDAVTQWDRMKQNDRYTLGITGKLGEFLGKGVPKKLKLGLDLRLDLFYSTYTKLGFSFGAGVNFAPNEDTWSKAIGPTGSLNLSYGSEDGISVTPSLGVTTVSQDKSKQEGKKLSASSSISGTYNTRSGLSQIGINAISVQAKEVQKVGKKLDSKNIGSYNIGSRFTLGNRSYIPTSFLPVSTLSFNGDFSLGLEIFFFHGGLQVTGGYTSQRLGGISGGSPILKRSLKPYGYMNYIEQRDYNQTDAVYDFNRENEGSLDDITPAFNLAFMTYDMFQVTAQGLSGAYRAHRASPITVISDGWVDINGGSNRQNLEGGDVGVEIGALKDFKGGLNLGVQLSEGHYGGWKKSELGSLMASGSSAPQSNSFYRPTYFKQVGTKTPLLKDKYNATFDDLAFQVPLNRDGWVGLGSLPWKTYDDVRKKVKIREQFKTRNGQYKNIAGSFKLNGRKSTPQPMVYYTADEMDRANCRYVSGSCKDMAYYAHDGNGEISLSSVTFDRITPERKANHISRIDVTRNDGYRYRFGLPAYNIVHKEMSFNIASGSQYVGASELCKYTETNGVPDGHGMSDYLNLRSYSPYAHSFMLTEVLSPDYFDMKGDGLTEDDLGDYVKFNYVEWFGKSNPFRWKSPAAWKEMESATQHKFANYNEGKASKNSGDIGDDMGFYTYGEKEVWYVRKMESKEKVALFHISRNNSPYARSLASEHGDYVDKKATAKLDSIQVFTRAEYDKVESGGIGIPEQTVHFRYNYELCKLSTSPNSGKLTLKRMFMTYRDSKKSAFTGYKFTYANNPSYATYKRDPWGYYQNEAQFTEVSPPSNGSPVESRPFNYYEFPYSRQNDKVQADYNTSAWNLTGIGLPTGGELKIEYEADDYGYVQNKRAGRVFQIAGFSSNTSGLTNKLYTSPSSSNNYLFVNLDNYDDYYTSQGETAPLSDVQYWAEAVKGMKFIPLRCLVDVTNGSDYEYVQLYAQLDNSVTPGVTTIGTSRYGYLKLKEQRYSRNPSKNSINPVVKHSLQMARQEFFQKILTGNINPSGIEKILKGLVGFAGEIKRMIRGQEKALLDRKFGSTVDISGHSIVVLREPWQRKIGGGSRVKRIAMEDNWDSMSGGTHLEGISGWEYKYTKTVTVQGQEMEVSSGVAEWEPDLASLENLNMEPVNVDEKRLLAPDNSYYQLMPYGRTVFPTPNVGYSHVEVTMIRPATSTGNQVQPIGKTEHEFYTAREFPVKTEHTQSQFEKMPRGPAPTFSLLGNRSASFGTASQGFAIILNDMHGKPKKEQHYRSSQTDPFRIVEYDYQLKGDKTNKPPVNPPFELDNEVTILSDQGTAYENEVGVEHEITIDTKEYFRATHNYQAAANLDITVIGIGPFGIPIIIPTFKPPYDSQTTFGRSITATKVVSKYAILDQVITLEDGAKSVQKNVAYDEITGNPILVQSINEFQDPVYSFTYPAHWMYPEFASREMRDGVVLSALKWNMAGEITSGYNVNGQLAIREGDILLNRSNSEVYQVYRNSSGVLSLADIRGSDYGTVESSGFGASSASVRVIAEGNKNFMTQNTGQVVSLENPIVGNMLRLQNPLPVLDASVQTFARYPIGDEACYCTGDLEGFGNNDVLKRLAETYRWYPETGYTQLRPRDYADDDGHRFNLRKDGTYVSFIPFWKRANSQWVAVPQPWTFTEKNTLVNAFGKPEELKDPLNRFTSFKWGHNQTLMRARIFNAKKGEGFLEDFEIIDPVNCSDGRDYLDEDYERSEGHTGVNSLSVEPGKEVKIYGKSE